MPTGNLEGSFSTRLMGDSYPMTFLTKIENETIKEESVCILKSEKSGL